MQPPVPNLSSRLHIGRRPSPRGTTSRREQELDQLRLVEQMRDDQFERRGNLIVLAIVVVVLGAILLGVLVSR